MIPPLEFLALGIWKTVSAETIKNNFLNSVLYFYRQGNDLIFRRLMNN